MCHILLTQMIFSLSVDANLPCPAQFKGVIKDFLDIALNLDLENCEYICFNSTLPNSPLQIKNRSIPSIGNFWWLGLTIC